MKEFLGITAKNDLKESERLEILEIYDDRSQGCIH